MQFWDILNKKHSQFSYINEKSIIIFAKLQQQNVINLGTLFYESVVKLDGKNVIELGTSKKQPSVDMYHHIGLSRPL